MFPLRYRFFSFLCFTAILAATSAGAQTITQQGNKLTGSGAVGAAQQGQAVALSGDGSTALIGGSHDNSDAGAAWVFTRDSNGNWTQQGSKLVGSGVLGGQAARQGSAVALSSNGSTALVGGVGDNGGIGATWVFTRDSNGNSTQQAKLVGSGALNYSGVEQGVSVALSADGNTALVGGFADNSNAGAVWVFTRDNNGNWTQQGSKLVGTGSVGSSYQGGSVALS